VLRLVVWGVPLVIASLTLVYVDKVLASRQQAPEPEKPEPPHKPQPEPKPKRQPENPPPHPDPKPVRPQPEPRPNPVEPEPEPDPKPVKPEPDPEPKPEQPRPEPKPEPAKPDPEVERQREKEAREAERRKREEEARKAELQDLFEKVLLYRGAREPEKLLVVLQKLKELRPKDPAVAFGLGEVYGSFGKGFDAKKACAEFRRFLGLTTEGRFDPGACHELYSFKDDIQVVRMQAHEYVMKLEEKHRLLLVTSHKALAKMRADLERELKDLHKYISRAKAKITEYERLIEWWRRSRRFDRYSQIKALKRKIALTKKKLTRAEEKIEFVNAELARIQEAIQR
jgi:hypothetical protein